MSEQVHWVAFFRDEDADGMEYEYDRWSAAIRTVDANGVPSWPIRWSEIRVGELVASSEAGLVDGDPLRPYFWPVIPQGDLATFEAALWTLWTTWEHVLSVTETSNRVKRLVAKRLRRAKSAATADHDSWSDALRRPNDLVLWLDEAPRTTDEIAQHCDLSSERTEGALWGLGYAQDTDGRWRPSADAASAAIRRSVIGIRDNGKPPDTAALAEEVRRIVENDSPLDG